VLALLAQDGAMSHGGHLYGLSGGVPPEPSFDIAVRGYKKDQVNSFIHSLATEIGALAAERDDAYAQLHALVAQMHRMETELRRLGANSGPPVRPPVQHPRAAGQGADD
jgi:hypothetical protein